MKLTAKQNNLFICLNDRINRSAIEHFVLRLAASEPEKNFTLICEGDHSDEGLQVDNLKVRYLTRTQFFCQSSYSQDFICDVKSVNKEINKVNAENFDRVFQIGPMQWGRWLLTAETIDVDESVYVETPKQYWKQSWLLVNHLVQLFGLTLQHADTRKHSVGIYPYVNGQLDSDFLNQFSDIEWTMFPWLRLLLKETDVSSVSSLLPDAQVIVWEGGRNIPSVLMVGLTESFCLESNRWGSASAFFDRKGEDEEFPLFIAESLKIRQNTGKFSSLEFVNLLNYWRQGRLSELTFMQSDLAFDVKRLAYECDQYRVKGINESLSELSIIRQLISSYKNLEDEKYYGPIIKKISEELSTDKVDRFQVYHAVQGLKDIILKMIDSEELCGSVYKFLSNDFYKISVAGDVIEATMSSSPTTGKPIQLAEALGRFSKYVSNLEVITDPTLEDNKEFQ